MINNSLKKQFSYAWIASLNVSNMKVLKFLADHLKLDRFLLGTYNSVIGKEGAHPEGGDPGTI